MVQTRVQKSRKKSRGSALTGTRSAMQEWRRAQRRHRQRRKGSKVAVVVRVLSTPRGGSSPELLDTPPHQSHHDFEVTRTQTSGTASATASGTLASISSAWPPAWTA